MASGAGGKRLVPLAEIGRRDHITLLPNREGFLAAHGALAAASRLAGDRVLVLVTLADARIFNGILRALGHAASDAFVRDGAMRVAALAAGAQVYHISLLSFAFVTGPGEAERAAARLAQGCAEPLVCAGIPIDARAGIGLRNLPAGRGAEAEDLRAALAAAQDGRVSGRGWSWYDKRSDDAHQRAFRLLTDIKSALAAEHGLSLVYQPKVDLLTGAVRSAEALVRWDHPSLGAVAPAEFVPLVEATALVTPLTRWVISTGVTELARWRRAGRDLALAVNVSPRNLEEPDFLEYLVFCCAAKGVPHRAVELEITEGLNAADGRLMLERLASLRRLGFAIAIDDFGSGYSNMSYLARLSAVTLKLDRSLVTGAGANDMSRRLLAGIVNMGRDLGYRMVAEGVETEADAALLRRLGAELGQGWHYARPMAPEDFLAWLDARREGRRAG